MSRLDHDRVMHILADTIELPAAQRQEFLDTTCAGEPELRQRLGALLACADGADAAFESLEHDIADPDPREIGPYSLLESIGEGGMAIVYRAQQHHPVRRVVAVKLIKLGMDTRQFVSRFESERQALAMMDHPNVARVYDAGSTDTGRPYFVLEYVPGESILEWCDKRELTLVERLNLFIPVCEAVEHAHRKGIIHRDLKNSNVLVTEVDGRAIPKVIDFGIAKLIAQPVVDRTVVTTHGQLIGTPGYISPEQAERGALDVDTRTDIYSLGVVLYELIAGVHPMPAELRSSSSYEKVLRIIRETEPGRPSTRLTALPRENADELAQRRGTSVQTLVRQVRSELEWIPLKAMRRDPNQRYRSAAELADDIRNYLSGHPLVAGPESRSYRARKFVLRHKTGVAASAAMVLLLIAGIISTTWQAIRAIRAERVAVAEKRQAQIASESLAGVNKFLTEDLLASAAPEITRGKELSVREAVDRAGESVATRFKDRPLTEAAVRLALCDTYDSLGQPAVALMHAQIASGLLTRTEGPNSRKALSAARIVGRQLNYSDRSPEGERLLRDILSRAREHLGENDEITLNSTMDLAASLSRQRRFGEAEQLYRRIVEPTRNKYGTDSEEMASLYNGLAVVLSDSGKEDEAITLQRETVRILRTKGEDYPYYMIAVSNLARSIERQGKLDEAEGIYRETLASRRRVLKDDHPGTLTSMNDLANILTVREKFDEAEAVNRDALERRLRLFGRDDLGTLQSMNNLGNLLERRGKYLEAEQVLRDTVERRRRVLSPAHPHTLGSTLRLVRALMKQSKWAEADKYLTELLRPAHLSQVSPSVQREVLELKIRQCEMTKQVDDAERYRLQLNAVSSTQPATDRN